MCCGKNQSANVETGTQPRNWWLQEQGSCWCFSIEVSSAQEVELSETVLKLKDRGELLIVDLPSRSLPTILDAATVAYSRKRGELFVKWPKASNEACNAEETCSTTQKSEEEFEETTTEEEFEAAAGEEVEEASEEERATDISEDLQGAPSCAATEMLEAESAQVWKTRGNKAVAEVDHEAAVVFYGKGLNCRSSAEEKAIIHSNRALCLQKLGRFSEAADDAQHCIALHRCFAKGYLRGAMALRSLGRFGEALAVLRRCPPNEEAAALMAELKLEAEAEVAAHLATLSGPDRLKEEGNVLFKKALFEPALAKYTQALEMCTDPVGELALALRNNRTACFHQLSNFSAVVQDADFVLTHQPGNIKALVRRMLALEPLERYEAALRDAREVLRIDPRHEVANRIQHQLGKLVRDMNRMA